MGDWMNYLTVHNIVVLILGIVGLVWLASNLYRNMKINSIRGWPKTNATIINALVEPVNNIPGTAFLKPSEVGVTNNSNKYIPAVAYRYNVNGNEYMSRNVVFAGEESYTAVVIKTMLGTLYPGAVTPIYYNPSNPAESYIYNGINNYTGTFIGIGLLLIALYLGFYHKTGKVNNVSTESYDLNSPSLTEIENLITKEATTVGNSVKQTAYDIESKIRNALSGKYGSSAPVPSSTTTITRTNVAVPMNKFY